MDDKSILCWKTVVANKVEEHFEILSNNILPVILDGLRRDPDVMYIIVAENPKEQTN